MVRMQRTTLEKSDMLVKEQEETRYYLVQTHRHF